MLKSYLKIAIRNLGRNRLTTALNVAGLSVGVAACLVIYLIVQFEFNFDQHVPNSGQVYRLVSKFKFGDDFYHNPGLSAPIPAAVRTELTGTKAVAAFHTGSFQVVEVPRPGAEPLRFRAPEKEHEWLATTDGNFFSILPRKWLAGSPATSLSKPGQVVLTERQARLYFGDASPAVVGRQLIGQQYRDTLALTVSGLIKDLDAPSNFDFQAFVALATVTTSKKRQDNLGFTEWNNTNSSSQCLLTLTPGTDPKRLGEQIIKMVERHMPASEEKGNRWFILQPLANVHFDADYASGSHVAHRPTLLILGLVGGFLLLLACINFINMATAQSTQRAKEIGVRKSLGSGRWQLMFQFLGETFVLTLLATGIALALAQGALVYLGDIVPTGVVLDFSHPHLYVFLISVALVTSLLAGLYPGIIVSRLSPVVALRNQTGTVGGSSRLRKVLIVGQFVVAQVFIVGALLVGQQLRFLINSDLGFQREAIVILHTPTSSFFNGDKQNSRFMLADRIQKLSGVERVSMANQTPIAGGWSTSTLEYAGKKGKIKVNVYRKEADTAYLALYGMKLVAGRNLLPSDTAREYVINETLAKRIGFQNPADAVGHVLDKLPIVGVVRDFHHLSLHSAIHPTALMSQKGNFYTFNVKLRRTGASGFDQTLAQIKTLWGATYPDDPFDPKFFDESVAELYGKERNLGKLITLATGIAVFISCLGLFGLVTFTAERRTKEIGVRKVLGASVASIVTLLSKDFLMLILIAVLIASPVAWWGVDRWLEDFAYKINIEWWLFILAALLAMGIALLTISFQSIKAALMNPVTSLRSE
ncbi:FtsX-like permease family protein [Spirosoma sp. HMF4905]|uniref:FtsX-like permease family protein n=1 Tax=Spirosoma arboris TaxID=2682092 RepID=A0A7K1SGX2_9BACT|nr:FtsX-like permease family protein [Spirosoma arboris]MVM33055.1 FtsX-like permease family protein [Spirosoma arboris]